MKFTDCPTSADILTLHNIARRYEKGDDCADQSDEVSGEGKEVRAHWRLFHMQLTLWRLHRFEQEVAEMYT